MKRTIAALVLLLFVATTARSQYQPIPNFVTDPTGQAGARFRQTLNKLNAGKTTLLVESSASENNNLHLSSRNLEGVEVILKDSAAECERTTKTDHFGDFRFTGLTAQSSSIELRVKRQGTETVIATRERTGSVNLGTLLC